MQTIKSRNESGFSLVELIMVSVILTIVIGITATVVRSVQTGYAEQRPRTEALNDATAALDMMTRLIRMAGNNPNNIAALQAINAGTAVSGQYKTIQIRGDWRGDDPGSPPDGDTNDPFENVTFSVSGGRLMKQEPSDTAPVEFLDNVSDLTFVYYDSGNVLVPNPVVSAALISRVDITLVVQTRNTPPMTFTSSAILRQK
jgi:prepilin-type N-terminal cleavage/methylation domain-containing protein